MAFPFLQEGNVFFKSSEKENLINFFERNKNPKDEKVHALAERLNIEPDELESEIYKLLSSFISGGKAHDKGITEKDVDAKELVMGMEVEMEHLDKSCKYAKDIAKKIALDHLAEEGMGKYYTLLLEMEKKAKGEKK